MPPASTFHLYDRIVGGDLTERLAAWRSEGISYAEIVHQLRTEHDVKVSAATIHRWCRDLGIATPEAAA